MTIPPQQYVLNTAGDLIGTLDDTGKLSITGTGTSLDKLLRNVLGDDASELTSLSFDTDTIEVIGDNWCNNYKSSSEVYFPNLAGELILPNNLKTIGNLAFQECKRFTGFLIIPDNVTSIGQYAFYYCKGFTGDLIIPDSVTKIGSGAFRGCYGFDGTLTLSNRLQTIPAQCFYDCLHLKGDLVIPAGVKTISDSAFGSSASNASKFKGGTLTLPDSVTTIEYCAFRSCGFTGILVLPNNLKTIGNYAFQYCDGFTGNLVIPENVTTIGQGAFYDCKGFTSTLIIPNSVTSIGKETFYNCSNIAYINIGTGITSMGTGIFKVSNETNTILRTSNEVVKAYDWAGDNRVLSYEVIYKDYSGDNTLYTEVVRSGNAATYVNDSVYEWVTEANGITVADLSSVTDFVTVYGFPAVNVTFKSYDGTVTYATERIKLGGSPSYTNSDVAEWYTEANGSTVANLTSVSADVTVFGKKACSYKVKLPLTVDLQYDSNRNIAEKDFSVSLEYTIPDDGTISVYVGDSRDFKVSIANTTDPSKTISADVSYENNSFTMANGTAREDGSRISDNTWTISASDIPVAGEYKGTMRFVIEYQE